MATLSRRMDRAIIGRSLRFACVGALCTLAAYLAFIGLARTGNYVLATFGAWFAGIALGFALNRGFTYRIKGGYGLKAQFILFMIGSALQMGIASAGYWLLIGKLHLTASQAFLICLPFTAGFMFAYMELVAFGRAAARGRRSS